MNIRMMFCALLFSSCLAVGCASNSTVTKSYTEQIAPDGSKNTIVTESIVQYQKNTTKKIELEHIK